MTHDMLWLFLHPRCALKILIFWHKTKSYNQNKISLASIYNWLCQFQENDREMIVLLFSYIRFYSQEKITQILLKQNENLLQKMKKNGIEPDHIIYITVDEPASSSHLMLNLLRDAGHLQRLRVHFMDSKNILGIIQKTNELGSGAIVYVDDFAGTGNQFLNSRKDIADGVPLIGQFPEFFLVPAICIEAHMQITKAGVEVIADHIHNYSDRPLHSSCVRLKEDVKNRLIEIAKEIDKGAPLGYRDLASMVVFYRNSPNSLPSIFRGNVGQDISKGIFPRNTDFHRCVSV